MSFGQRVLDFNQSLQPDWQLPPEVELLHPFDQAGTWRATKQFYHRYYADEKPRIAILGINPGRFGAGVTGVPFTDPVTLGIRVRHRQ